MLSFVFLRNSLSTASLNFFKSKGTVFNLPTSKSPTFVFKLFKLVEALKNSLIYSLSTSAFKAIKQLATKSDVSTHYQNLVLF